MEEMTTTEEATGQRAHIMNPCAMVSLHDTARTTNSCIFTYNRFQKNDATELGIGPHYNANNKGWDWTQTYNAGQYSLRHFQVYVLPDTADRTPPAVVSAECGFSRQKITVTFSEPVAEANLANTIWVDTANLYARKNVRLLAP